MNAIGTRLDVRAAASQPIGSRYFPSLACGQRRCLYAGDLRILLPLVPLGGRYHSPGSASALIQGSKPMISDLGSPPIRGRVSLSARRNLLRPVSTSESGLG